MGRKIFLMAAGLIAFSQTFAQSLTPVTVAPSAPHRVATNDFGDNWELYLGLNYTSWWGNEEKNLTADRNFFGGYRTSFGFSAGGAKWFSPDIAVRALLTGVRGKRVVSDDDPAKNDIDYWHLQMQTMFSLTNLIWDYKPERIWDVRPYLGIGLLRNCTDNQYVLTSGIGINLSRRLTQRIRLFAEVEYNLAISEYGRQGSWSDNFFHRHDHWTKLSVGVTLDLGKNDWDKVPDMDAVEVVPWKETKRQLSESQSEVNRLSAENETLRNRPEKVITKTVKSHPDVSIFFEMGSHSLTKRGQLENLKRLVETAKAENRVVQVTGYADSQTGSPQYNDMLSARRADTIVKELLLMGLRIDQIRIVSGGGVDMINPKPANRRVVVSLM